MPTDPPPGLSQLYEDYLATLDAIEARASREALQDWDRFIDGRPPGEVDGARREWFELHEEERGRTVAEVKDFSERVGRFYSWLSMARPEALGGGNKPQPKRGPGRDPNLPPPPFELASDPKLWVQGPSVGPPPTAQSAPLGPRGRPIEAARQAAARSKRAVPLALVSLTLLGLVAVALPYALIFSPRSALEADVETYLSTADRVEMDRLYEWLFPKAESYGFMVDPENVHAQWIETIGSKSSYEGLHQILLTFDASQDLWSATLPVHFEISGLSRNRPPDRPPSLKPAGAETAPEASPLEPGGASDEPEGPRVPQEQLEEIRAIIDSVRVAMSNYRTAAPGAPGAAAQVLAADMEILVERLSKVPEGSRGRPGVERALHALLSLAREKPDPSRMENEFFTVGVNLREADRLAPLAAKQ